MGDNTMIVNSYLHDLSKSGEAIKTVGADNVQLLGNYVVGPVGGSGAALELSASRRPVSGWTVEGNVLEGGRSTVRLFSRGHPLQAVAFVNNLWVDGSWSGWPVRASVTPSIWTGNVLTTGGEIPAPGPGNPEQLEVASPGSASPAVQATSLAGPLLPQSSAPDGGTTTTGRTGVGTLVTMLQPAFGATTSVPAITVPSSQATPETPSTRSGDTNSPLPTGSTSPQSTTTTRPAVTSTTASTAPLPPPSAACSYTNPNDPSDDPNPTYSGGYGRYPVSSNSIPAGFPTPLTTGICGAGLTVSDLQSSGGLTITEDGTVIDGRDIQGSVNVQANNVTIRNSQITSTGRYALYLHHGYTGLTVENTRVRASGESVSAAVYLRGFATLQRVHITGGADLMKAEAGVLVEDSYFAATYLYPGSHNDVVQVRRGSNYTFRRNSMFGPWRRATSVFLFQGKTGAGGGPISDVLLEGNYLSGGGYTIYTMAPDFPLTNIVVRNNRIELDSWQFGWRHDTADATDIGNVQIQS